MLCEGIGRSWLVGEDEERRVSAVCSCLWGIYREGMKVLL